VEKNKPKKTRRKIGDILQIKLNNDFHVYGHVTTDPAIIFYDGMFKKDLPLDEIIKLPVLFTLFVYNYAITQGIWPVIGNSKLSEEKLVHPYMYKQDTFTKKLYIYHADFADTNYERPATIEECKGLECAAVWEPEHVVDRLLDHYAGRPNKWVEQLAIQP